MPKFIESMKARKILGFTELTELIEVLIIEINVGSYFSFKMIFFTLCVTYSKYF